MIQKGTRSKFIKPYVDYVKLENKLSSMQILIISYTFIHVKI
jgi:hypothetical protein